MGMMAVLGWTSDIEPLLWLAAMVFSVVLLKKKVETHSLANGIALGLAWGVSTGLVLFLFFGSYLDNNPEFVSSYTELSKYINPRIFVLISSLTAGLVSGLLMGVALLIWKRVG